MSRPPHHGSHGRACPGHPTTGVMAGLVPATHALLAELAKDVGARDKRGHDSESAFRQAKSSWPGLSRPPTSCLLSGIRKTWVPATSAGMTHPLRHAGSKQTLIQISPFRIESMNQPNFPGARPMLDV